MKKYYPFCSFILLSILASSCQTNQRSDDEVVCETVHRYGVQLEPEDWLQRGQNGQVRSIRKDGVTVTRNYEGGVLHGECSYSFPDREVVQKRELYDRGALNQESNYYSNGLPQKQLNHESPTKKASLIWYESGAPQSREEFENGNLIKGEYYSTDQQIESQVNDSNGLRTLRDGQGQLQSVETIQKGQKVLSTTYHPDGTPATVTPYANGLIQGQRLTYLPGGEPSTVEEWTRNVQHGSTTVFLDGEKKADVPYVNGKKHGMERNYRDGEKVVHETPWVKGEKHGPSKSYIGNTTQVDWYYQGRKIPNEATFDMMSNQ